MKRILPILSFILLTTLCGQAQDSRGPIDGAGRILKIYPNPATSTYITFDFQKNYQKGMTISIFNFLGKKMSETTNVSEKTTVTLTDFNRGMYIYHLTDPSGKLIDTGKFQVSK